MRRYARLDGIYTGRGGVSETRGKGGPFEKLDIIHPFDDWMRHDGTINKKKLGGRRKKVSTACGPNK